MSGPLLCEIYSILDDIERQATEKDMNSLKLVFGLNSHILRDQRWINGGGPTLAHLSSLETIILNLHELISIETESHSSLEKAINLVQAILKNCVHAVDFELKKESSLSDTPSPNDGVCAITSLDAASSIIFDFLGDDASLPSIDFTGIPIDFNTGQDELSIISPYLDIFGARDDETEILEIHHASYQLLMKILHQITPLSEVACNIIWGELSHQTRMSIQSAKTTNQCISNFVTTTIKLLNKINTKSTVTEVTALINPTRFCFDFNETDSLTYRIKSDINELFSRNPVTPKGKTFSARATLYSIKFMPLKSIDAVIWSYFVSQSRLFSQNPTHGLQYRQTFPQEKNEASCEFSAAFAHRILDALETQSITSKISMASVAALIMSSIDFNPIEEKSYSNYLLSCSFFNRISAKDHTFIISRILHMFASLTQSNQEFLVSISSSEFRNLIIQGIEKVNKIFTSQRLPTPITASHELSQDYLVTISQIDADIKRWSALREEGLSARSQYLIDLLSNDITSTAYAPIENEILSFISNSKTANPLFDASWSIALTSLMEPIANQYHCNARQFVSHTNHLVELLSQPESSSFFGILQIACASTSKYISSLTAQLQSVNWQTQNLKRRKTDLVPSPLVFIALQAKTKLDAVSSFEDLDETSDIALNAFWSSLDSDTHYSTFDLFRAYFMKEGKSVP